MGGTVAASVALGAACTSAQVAPTAAPVSGAVAPTTPATAPVATPTAQRQPKLGGTFAFAFPLEAPHLDVHQTGTALLHMWGPGVAYSRLVGYRVGAGVAPGTIIARGDLAESWDQPDDLTFVFKLRQGAKFHNIPPVNGREVVASDVVYSFNRQIGEKVNAGFLGALTKIEAPDKYTVKITVSKPDVEYPLWLADGRNKIVAREAVDLKGDLKEGPTIGSGPFILEKWDKNVLTALVKNPDYFLKGLPYIDRLEFPRIQDDAARLAAFRAEQLSVAPTGLARTEVELLRKEKPNFQFIVSRLPVPLRELGMNKKTGPTADKRVRQAISKALNRQEIIDTAVGGAGWPTTHFVLPSVDWVIPESELKQLYARDVAGAKKLLADAGYPNGLDIELAVSNTQQQDTSTGEQVAAQLQEIGVRARIRVVDNVQYADQVISKNQYEMYAGFATTVGATNQDLFTRLHSKGTRLGQVLDDPKLDDMIEKQSVMRDVEQRKRALLEIQRYLITDAVPSAVIHGSQGTDVWVPSLRDLVSAPSPAPDHYTFVWFDK
jgi:peptide/nickel transport system substrate-binding protein